jgi:hypothetical protein
MKLIIDTTDKDNVKIQCDTLNAYELGMCIGKYAEIIADEMDLHSYIEKYKPDIVICIRDYEAILAPWGNGI